MTKVTPSGPQGSVCFSCGRSAAEVTLLKRLQGDLACPDHFREAVARARPGLPVVGGEHPAVKAYREQVLRLDAPSIHAALRPSPSRQQPAAERTLSPDEGDPDPARYYVLSGPFAIRGRWYAPNETIQPGFMGAEYARKLRVANIIAPIWEPPVASAVPKAPRKARRDNPEWVRGARKRICDAYEAARIGPPVVDDPMQPDVARRLGYSGQNRARQLRDLLHDAGMSWPPDCQDAG